MPKEIGGHAAARRQWTSAAKHQPRTEEPRRLQLPTGRAV